MGDIKNAPPRSHRKTHKKLSLDAGQGNSRELQKQCRLLPFFLRGPLNFGKPLLKKLYALVTRHGEIMPVLAWKYPLSWPIFTLKGTPKLQ